jgi:hypothetical protein
VYSDDPSFAGFRHDVFSQGARDLAEVFGENIKGLNMSIFANVDFTERRGNAFGHSFYVHDTSGEQARLVQIKRDQKQWEHLYAFLYLASAKCTDYFLRHGHWQRFLHFKLSENPDVANLLEQSNVLPKGLVIAA